MKVYFVSLGCDKNRVDSEQMLGLLRERGMEITDDETQADAAVVNTCGFILDAQEESVQAILEMAELKETANLKSLIVTGCLAERYTEEIYKEIPEVDGILGTNSYDEIVTAIETTLRGTRYSCFKPLTGIPKVSARRMISPPFHYGYLKIAEGCEKHCTYCIIPKMRGSYRSVPMEELEMQARQLVEDGVRELVLVAQESTLYGVDLYGEKKLPELIRRLSAIEDLAWIRILYCYPEEITPELIQVIKENPKVCHYLDLPIQHVQDEILKRMGRKTTEQDLRQLIKALRKEVPDSALRATLIAGFPGETQAMHENLMAFLDEMEFDRLGVFSYSPEEGTPAATFPDQLPEETKDAWRDEIMELQQEITADANARMVGRTVDALVDGYLPGEDVYVGRTYRDAPDVDGYVFFQSSRSLLSGDMVPISITGADGYDLTGEMKE